jgi:hypothetical protein
MPETGAQTIAKPSAGPGIPYRLQRVYVGRMMWVVGRLLQAAAAVDPVIAGEIAGLGDGFSFAMRVRGSDLGFAMRKTGGTLRRVSIADAGDVQLSFDFKHVTHSFLVLGFVEGTARSFANDRMSVDGELAAAMKIVRCLNRMEAIVLPGFVARRAVKEYPDIGLTEKLGTALRIYGRLIVQLPGGR